MPRKLKKSWISSYVDYLDQSESPTSYNLWCAISALSSSLKKNVYMSYGYFKIYANQYIILVGPPGVGKGTAINPAVELAKAAGTVNYIADKVTAEKIVEKLAKGFTQVTTTVAAAAAVPLGGIKNVGNIASSASNNSATSKSTGSSGSTNIISISDSTATIVQSELAILFHNSEWILPLLCSLWEKGEFNYDTKTKGTAEAKDMCVSLLGGCVSQFIGRLNKDGGEAITGGFTSRCITVFAPKKGRTMVWPTFGAGHDQLKADIIEDLKAIANLKGEFTFSKEAYALLSEYCNSGQFNPGEFDTEMIINFKARMKSHVIKTAMALCVSESDTLVITRSHLFNAMAMIGQIKESVDIVFRAVGESPLAVAQDRVLSYVQRRGLTTFSEIFRDNYKHITDTDLRRVMLVLVQAGYVCETKTDVYEDTGRVKP